MERGPSQHIEDRLSAHIGRHTARNALKLFCAGRLGLDPAAIAVEDVPRVLDALRPMLNTLIGPAASSAFLVELLRELDPKHGGKPSRHAA